MTWGKTAGCTGGLLPPPGTKRRLAIILCLTLLLVQRSLSTGDVCLSVWVKGWHKVVEDVALELSLPLRIATSNTTLSKSLTASQHLCQPRLLFFQSQILWCVLQVTMPSVNFGGLLIDWP
jgi:hypothetical protein